jgi:integrin beta 8
MQKTILAATIIACAASATPLIAQEAPVPVGPDMGDAGGRQNGPGVMPMAHDRPQAYAGAPGVGRAQGDPRMRANPQPYTGTTGGYQGYPDNQGYSGVQGYPDNQGYSGFQGYPGNQGYPGYSGYRGYTGYQGYPGNQGFPGMFGGNQGWPNMMGGSSGWPGMGGNQGWPNMMGGSQGWPGMMGGRQW